MYYDDHEPAHFHVLYEGEEAMFGFNGSLLRGFISERGRKLVEEWALLHTKGLEDNWKRARQNLPLNWIEPLR